MFGYDSKIILKNILACVGEKEMELESLRQQLACIADFEPYTCFKRLDQANIGHIGAIHFQ